MLVHSVFFWLKPGLPPAVHQDFKQWLVKLTSCGSVDHGYVGAPSSTDRPVIDRSYTFALTVMFASMREHDQYQADPDHLKFLELHKGHWSKVVIYDAE
jgi:hypothetical protein